MGWASRSPLPDASLRLAHKTVCCLSSKRECLAEGCVKQRIKVGATREPGLLQGQVLSFSLWVWLRPPARTVGTSRSGSQGQSREEGFRCAANQPRTFVKSQKGSQNPRSVLQVTWGRVLEQPPSQVTERAELKTRGPGARPPEMGWFENSSAAVSPEKTALGAGLGLIIRHSWASDGLGCAVREQSRSPATQEQSSPSQAPACPLGGFEGMVSRLSPGPPRSSHKLTTALQPQVFRAGRIRSKATGNF